MTIKFNNKGHITPPERIILTLNEFEEYFVNLFEQNSNRLLLFENYKKFIHDFSKQVTPNFIHWVDGSFVTQKESPNDIDFVSLIDYDIYEANRVIINSRFRLKNAKKLYQVDAYTLVSYPENHKKYSIHQIDLVYWDNWFSKTKKNWAKKSFPKGYIEIQFGDKCIKVDN